LHIDHNQRGARRNEIVVHVLAAMPRHHAVGNRLRYNHFVHRNGLPSSAGDYAAGKGVRATVRRQYGKAVNRRQM
jgi:hypothetical protein